MMPLLGHALCEHPPRPPPQTSDSAQTMWSHVGRCFLCMREEIEVSDSVVTPFCPCYIFVSRDLRLTRLHHGMVHPAWCGALLVLYCCMYDIMMLMYDTMILMYQA